MLTKALMKGPTMLQALINLGGMKKVWTAACLVVRSSLAWLGLGYYTGWQRVERDHGDGDSNILQSRLGYR